MIVNGVDFNNIPITISHDKKFLFSITKSLKYDLGVPP